MNVEFPRRFPLLQRLDESSCGLCKEAAARIRQMQKEARERDREALEDSRAAAAEALWKERQGDDEYGSY